MLCRTGNEPGPKKHLRSLIYRAAPPQGRGTRVLSQRLSRFCAMEVEGPNSTSRCCRTRSYHNIWASSAIQAKSAKFRLGTCPTESTPVFLDLGPLGGAYPTSFEHLISVTPFAAMSASVRDALHPHVDHCPAAFRATAVVIGSAHWVALHFGLNRLRVMAGDIVFGFTPCQVVQLRYGLPA